MSLGMLQLAYFIGLLFAFVCGHSHIRDYDEFVSLSVSESKDAITPGRLFPLHWMSPILSGTGFGSEALAYAMGVVALRAEGIYLPFSVEQHGDSYNHQYIAGLTSMERDVLQMFTAGGGAKPGIVVCHSEPGAWQINASMPQRYSTSICPKGNAKYKIGRVMFETDRLPSGWAARLNSMDEVWVPTRFSREVFVASGVHEEKLLVLPESVDTDFFKPQEHAVAIRQVPFRNPSCVSADSVGKSSECPVRFLTVGKWERRKNFEALLRAFITEFLLDTVHDNRIHAELYILTSAYHSSSDFVAQVVSTIREQLACDSEESRRISEMYADDLHEETVQLSADGTISSRMNALCVPKHVDIDDILKHIKLLSNIPQRDMSSMYNTMDVFVSPTRGEGWGRPHMEALSCGLPVIATNWSGLTEFLHDHNSFPVRVKHMAPIPDGAFMGHLQAEVDLLHLRERMRFVAQHLNAAKSVAAEGRREITQKYTLEKVARFIYHQVVRISETIRSESNETM